MWVCGGGVLRGVCGRGERAARRAVGLSRRGEWRGRAAGAFCGVVRRQREESGGSVLRGVQRARAGGGGGGRGRGRAEGACGKGVRQGRVVKESGWDLLRGRPGVRWGRAASRWS